MRRGNIGCWRVRVRVKVKFKVSVKVTVKVMVKVTVTVKVTVRVGVRLRLRLEGGKVGSAITTLDKKACEGLVWLYAMHPCQNHSPSS